MTQSTMKRCARPDNACQAPAEMTDGARTPAANPLPTATPRADIWETEDAAHLAIELPGVAEDGLELQVENDRLTLTATPDAIAAEGRMLRREWRPARFQRTFVLTDDADREAIEAHLRHGLLTVRVPRRAEKRPRSVPIRVTAD